VFGGCTAVLCRMTRTLSDPMSDIRSCSTIISIPFVLFERVSRAPEGINLYILGDLRPEGHATY
jgi:hypothetical protein